MADIEILSQRAHEDSLGCANAPPLSNFYLHNKDACPHT